ncbi:tetratricopeptide repeat protein [Laribacter hongkongensis]|uniref:YfgM family protein n=1 Tax=Laribacter hongkongensis TaxID=168471 RepID=UPI001EFD2D5D|nr:tetratricopeptide repeat protein [Laribacter hongkongensis]MCG9064187.1 tetratricopeptide repeat protein [Laribacter hongkongensis]MCG9114534.1 tetratricopeptide repeat protein [Laribacter hongkongensis]
MAFDLQEQEQIDAAKAFWQQWGKWISLAVIVVALGYLGYQGWKYYRSHQAEQAALLYAPVETAVTEGDAGKLVASAKALQDAYPKSGYAARASLLAARVAFDKGDTKTAEQELRWVAGNAAEPAVKAVAQLRLAGLQLDAGQTDAALAELARSIDATFLPQQLELKGDALLVKGDRQGARAAYQEAIAKLAPDAPQLALLNVKLDALGGEQ